MEKSLEAHPGQTLRGCINCAKQWRTGKMLRHLEASMLVIDRDLIIELDGTGNVLEIEDVMGIGSGGLFAECAARALLSHTQLQGEDIVRKSMAIAADKCLHTSHHIEVQKVV